MVTLKDIARECKVSFSTVSKALKGSPEISLETTEFVQKKAREMGYHPNLAARTLRTNKTYDIGLIFEEKTGVGLQHEYFASVISGIQKVAFQKGYDITFVGGNSLQNYDYCSHALARSYDGVAILSCDFTSQGIINLIKSDIPVVTLDYSFDDSHSAVLSDSATGVKELTEYVISMGHTKIAMVHGEDTWVTQQRVNAFKKICAERGIKIPEEYFLEVLYHDADGCAEATKKLLSLPEPPTCIFYPDDYASLGGMRALSRMHLTPGKDISIVGYDGINLTSMMIPPLTTYEQNGKQIGNAMAEALFNQIEKGDQFVSKSEFINGRVLKGGTVVKLN